MAAPLVMIRGGGMAAERGILMRSGGTFQLWRGSALTRGAASATPWTGSASWWGSGPISRTTGTAIPPGAAERPEALGAEGRTVVAVTLCAGTDIAIESAGAVGRAEPMMRWAPRLCRASQCRNTYTY